nr:hypothetical protein [Candidatus Cloacimonadota bacterium]
MQIIRTLGKLADCNRELALDSIVGSELKIELASIGQEAQEVVILAWIQCRLQLKAILPVFFSLVDNGGVKGILLLDAILTPGDVFYLSMLTAQEEHSLRVPSDELKALYSSHAFTLYSSLLKSLSSSVMA